MPETHPQLAQGATQRIVGNPEFGFTDSASGLFADVQLDTARFVVP